MKLDQILAIAAAGGFFAADKTPAQLEAAVIAADKSLPGNVASSKEIMDKKTARDAARSARDAKRADDRKARDKAVMDKKATDRAARDAKAMDARKALDGTDPDCTNDGAMDAEAAAEDAMEAEDENYSKGDPASAGGKAPMKPAVDAAADTAVAVAAAVAARDDLHAARVEVEPVLGKVTMDSAAEVRRAALVKLGVDVKGVHDSALAGMLTMAKDRAAAPAAPVTPAATVSGMEKIVPGYGRLK